MQCSNDKEIRALHAGTAGDTNRGMNLSHDVLGSSEQTCPKPYLSQDVLHGAAVERRDAVLQQRAQQDDAGDGRQLLALRAPAEQRPQHGLRSALDRQKRSNQAPCKRRAELTALL